MNRATYTQQLKELAHLRKWELQDEWLI